MSFRRIYYTRPTYLENYTRKQPDYIMDFGQLERKADYYRTRSVFGRYVVPALVGLFFLTLFAVTGYYSVTPGKHFTAVPFPTEKKIALVQPTTAPKKVVESVRESSDEKLYTYTVQNGDSYARLVKRAVTDFSLDHDLTLSRSQLNYAANTIILGLNRTPLHPSDVFTLSSKKINDVLVTIYP